eukprot:TRINITY_DN8199_c1_g1_i3.p2 TRINITY_DN8199_c1_g1~~TRINITY_DN8199_c1_g1_i3.p2  ORF type:complete len:149 (+),score=68.16 TRINITY_DN8199_c1_g1_i3:57-503(+)
MIHFVLLVSRQGKVRLAKWYSPFAEQEKAKAVREISTMVIGRQKRLCNFLEWRDYKLVWRRYATLHFVACIDKDDNELINLEIIQHFVESLDRHYGHVCELDLIFNFQRAYHILDEVLAAGELQESSKNTIQKLFNQQEAMIQQAEAS